MGTLPPRQPARRIPGVPASLAPRTAGRASQIATAVRLAAEGLGVTIAPASAIPDGFEHLTRPLRPALSEPVIAGLRHTPGRAESALLDHLNRQDWSGGGRSDDQ